MDGLDGRTYLITAGASGIGKAIAAALLDAGANVAIADLSAEGVQAALSEFAASGGSGPSRFGRVTGIAADAGDPDSFDAAIAHTHEFFGTRIHGLVNNAGITAPRLVLAEASREDFERLIRVNVLGTFHGIQWALRHGSAESPIAVVNTASAIALRGAPHHGIYAATKSAVMSLTHTAAAEGAPHVRVNGVLPGPTATPTLLAAPPERRAEYDASIPMGRLGTPEEVAAAAVWLLSDASSFVTGQLIAVDGGQSA